MIGDKVNDFCQSLIVGIIGLVGVVLGFFLRLFSNYLSESKHIKEEFSEIKNSIYSVTTANQLFPELLKLKRFFLRYSKFLKRKENNHFNQKWLMISFVDEAFTGVGCWTDEKIKEMYGDLDKTRL